MAYGACTMTGEGEAEEDASGGGVLTVLEAVALRQGRVVVAAVRLSMGEAGEQGEVPSVSTRLEPRRLAITRVQWARQ